MEFLPQKLVFFLLLAFVGSFAAPSPEVYWKTVLPNTPMPKAVKDLLPPSDVMEDKGVSVGVSGGGVQVNTPGGTNVNVGPGGGVAVNTPGGTVNVGPGGGAGGGGGGGGGGGAAVNTPGGTNVNVEHGGGGGHGKKPGGTDVNVGHGGGVTVIPGHHHKGKPVNVGVKPFPFRYDYAANKDQLHDNPNVALFFLENNMTQGSTMSLHFFKTSNGATFLPRQVAESIPLSSNKVEEILKRFSVKSHSEEAEVMQNTIKECEEPGIQGEEKFCATSLEAMVDFSTSKLGKNIEALSTNAMNESPQQKYTITGVKRVTNDKAVVCHQQDYAYAVFYCHKTHTTRAYMVSMVGVDRTKVKAVAVCHEDTTKWNPNHLAFQVLKIKPGHVPVCHFLPEDHIVWVPK